MNGSELSETARLFADAARNRTRNRRLRDRILLSLLGGVGLSVLGAGLYSISMWVGCTLGAFALVCFVACFMFFRKASRERKSWASTSNLLTDLARRPGSSTDEDWLSPGEFLGNGEVLFCDNAMLMISRNRSLVIDSIVRGGMLILGSAIILGEASLILLAGTKILSAISQQPKLLLLLIGGPVFGGGMILKAVQRRSIRWYVSREEGIVRLETVRNVFVHAIEDFQLSQVESICLHNDEVLLRIEDGTTRHLQRLTECDLVGSKLNEKQMLDVQTALRQLQCRRLEAAVEAVLRDD